MNSYKAKQDIFSPYTGRKLFVKGTTYKQVEDPSGFHELTLEAEPKEASGVRHFSLDGQDFDMRPLFTEVDNVFTTHRLGTPRGASGKLQPRIVRCSTEGLANFFRGEDYNEFSFCTMDAPSCRELANLLYKVARELEGQK